VRRSSWLNWLKKWHPFYIFSRRRIRHLSTDNADRKSVAIFASAKYRHRINYRKGSAKVRQSKSQWIVAHCQGTSRYLKPGCVGTIIIEIILNTRTKSKDRNRKVHSPNIAQHVPMVALYRNARALEHAFAKRCGQKNLGWIFYCDIHQRVYSKIFYSHFNGQFITLIHLLQICRSSKIFVILTFWLYKLIPKIWI